MKALALTTLLFAGSLAAAAEPLGAVAMGAANELVRITRADELFWNMSRNSSREMFAEKRITASEFQCFEAVKLEKYTRTIATIFARDLTIEEILLAVDFFSSPTGAKFQHMAYQLNWERTPKEFPLKVEGPKLSVNYAELVEIGRYRESAGGLRLANPLTFLNRPEQLSEILALFLEARLVCEGSK